METTSKPEQIKMPSLTPQQEAFCQFYTQDSDLFSNASLSYAEAYQRDLENKNRVRQVDGSGEEIEGSSEYDKEYAYCRMAGSRLITNDNVLARINELLSQKLTDTIADSRLARIIMRGSDRDALGAIRHYNELKQRITKRSEVSVSSPSGIDLNSPNAELMAFIRQDRQARAERLKEKIME